METAPCQGVGRKKLTPLFASARLVRDRRWWGLAPELRDLLHQLVLFCDKDTGECRINDTVWLALTLACSRRTARNRIGILSRAGLVEYRPGGRGRGHRGVVRVLHETFGSGEFRSDSVQASLGEAVVGEAASTKEMPTNAASATGSPVGVSDKAHRTDAPAYESSSREEEYPHPPASRLAPTSLGTTHPLHVPAEERRDATRLARRFHDRWGRSPDDVGASRWTVEVYVAAKILRRYDGERIARAWGAVNRYYGDRAKKPERVGLLETFCERIDEIETSERERARRREWHRRKGERKTERMRADLFDPAYYVPPEWVPEDLRGWWKHRVSTLVGLVPDTELPKFTSVGPTELSTDGVVTLRADGDAAIRAVEKCRAGFEKVFGAAGWVVG